jgi:PAS domain S-box-containing protein
MFNCFSTLDDKKYHKLFENMSYGFAYFEMIYDRENNPIDCRFLDINKSFRIILDLSYDIILGKNISEVIPTFKLASFDYISGFNKVASTCEGNVFTQYIYPLNKWLEFSVFSDELGFFAMTIHEIINEKYNFENLKILNNYLIEYIKFPPNYIDYKMVTDDLLKLSGAKYTYIAILSKKNSQVTIEAVSGEVSHIKKVSNFIGFNPIGSKWKTDEDYLQQIRSQKLHITPLNNEVFIKKVPHVILKYLKRRLNFGEFWSIGLLYNEELLGAIYMIMPPKLVPANPELIELFSQQLSIVFLRFKAEQELKETREKLQFALEGSGDGIWDWNLITNELIFSDKYKEILGYTKNDSWNNYSDWEKLVFPEDLKILINQVKRYLASEIPNFSIEYRLKHKNGNYIWILASGKTISWNADCKPIRMVGTIKDITERKQWEEELRKEKEKAEILSFNKSEYIANMSHELRTPLNVMLGAIQLFELYLTNNTTFSKEKVNKHLKSMSQNCFRLLRLVNNLIDTTKIETGFYKINLQNHNIVNIVEEITLSVLEYVKQKGIELSFDTYVEEKIIACDIDMIERIMFNLLSNAIKFSKPCSCISVTIYDEEEYLKISVKDTGVGIPIEKQEIIFERYKQVDQLLTRQHEGSGIGLSLTKSIIEMHGGRLSVKSEVGVGSEFIVELPVKTFSDNNVSQERFDYIYNNQILVEKMKIEFSDIYK